MKKVIKIAASTAVAASAFVAVAPTQQADAATNVNQLITDAQNAGTVLKWAISVEGTADYKTEPWKEYNAAKDALKKAEAAINGLGTSAKLSAQAKLVDPKVQITRAGAYIDAITSGKKILDKNAAFEAAVKSGNLDAVEKAYHVVTEEFRKQTILNYRVFGQSTRDEILKEYKLPIEKTVRDYASEVTVHMLTKAAAVDVKAGKVEDAAKKLTEAQALIDAEVLTWESTLQKSLSDVEASIPLSVLSVVSDNKNTVTVKFSTKIQPGAAVLPAGQFTFTNGLIVQSATVAADGKTVTLKTTEQSVNKEYTLSYQGTSTGKSFKTPAAANDGTLGVVETDVANLNDGGERAYTVNVTKADGTPYTGQVKVELYNAAKTTILTETVASVKTVNGVTVNPDAGTNAVYTVNAVNGKVTFVVADVPADTTLTVVPKITRLEDESFKFAPSTTFWALATTGLTDQTVNDVTVDEKNGFLYLNTGSSLEQKFFFDNNDKFYFKNVEVSQADFFKALSELDVVTVKYATTGTAYNKDGISEFIINTDVTADAALKVTNPAGVLTADTNATRLAGTSQANHIIEVYKGTTASGVPVAETKVASDGTWVVNSLNLTAGELNQFVVTSRPVGSQTPAVGYTSSVVNVYQQFFATTGDNTDVSTGLFVTDTDGNTKIGIGDVITFNVNNPTLAATNNNLKVATDAKITLQDDQGYTRYYNVAKVSGTNNKVVITGVEVKSIADNYNASIGAALGNTLLKVEGLSNQDNLLFNVKESKDIKLDIN